MVYIFESELPKNKSILFALTNIFGVGKLNSFLLCKKLGFSQNLKITDLSQKQIIKLIKNIESSNLILASDLKKERFLKLKKLLSIKSYKGLRRNQGLPIRGQRTHTNARTSRKRK
jgi:small subunit ribosomal protein S13